MGQKNIRSQDSLIIDRMLLESFKDTDLSFPFQEITKMKLRFKDAEKYFGIKFDYLVFYNNYIFHEGISILYDNYIKKIEQFSKNKENNKRKKNEKIFYLFVDFDDESENLINGYDIEFEPLFTIIFEKLEIRNVTCFSLMNCNKSYVNIFFNQLFETVYFYKTNRNFDCLYFLLPNADTFIKNENYVLYFGNKTDIKIYSYYNLIFNALYFKDLVNVIYPHSQANDKIYEFLNNINKSLFIKCAFNLNINYNDMLLFLSDYDNINNIHKLLINKSEKIQLYCFLTPILNIDVNQNLSNFIKNLIINFDNSKFENSNQEIKIINYECKAVKENKKVDMNKEKNKSRNKIKDYKELSEIEEVNETVTIKKPFEKKYKLIQIDKIIQMLINLSFSKNEKKRKKLIIEYIEINSMKRPSSNNLVQNNLLELKKGKNNVRICNNFDDEGVESENLKNKTSLIYSKELLIYNWFSSIEECNNIKITIITCIIKKNKGFNSLENKEKNNKIKLKNFFQLLFDFIFYKNNKYFYCSIKKKENLTSNQNEFENNLYI